MATRGVLSTVRKFTHQDCNYRMGTPQEACANCHHFQGNSCEIVEDPITAEMLCDFHAPGQPQVRGSGVLSGGY